MHFDQLFIIIISSDNTIHNATQVRLIDSSLLNSVSTPYKVICANQLVASHDRKTLSGSSPWSYPGGPGRYMKYDNLAHAYSAGEVNVHHVKLSMAGHAVYTEKASRSRVSFGCVLFQKFSTF